VHSPSTAGHLHILSFALRYAMLPTCSWPRYAQKPRSSPFLTCEQISGTFDGSVSKDYKIFFC
jgi:hypothetical protein